MREREREYICVCVRERESERESEIIRSFIHSYIRSFIRSFIHSREMETENTYVSSNFSVVTALFQYEHSFLHLLNNLLDDFYVNQCSNLIK